MLLSKCDVQALSARKNFWNNFRTQIFFVEHFFRSLGIRRSKRGDHTMRQSISMMQNMSYKEFFELGTKWKLVFMDGI